MTHLGDITQISGYNAPVVDCIIGGSPCQDLSIAGKRAGLAGERSGLFMEQVRIVKEMRDNECKHGRAARPRFLVWENVVGALSSNNGEDFGAVLEEIIRVAEPSAPDVPRPKKWPLADAYIGDGWSIAYRILNAQFWGVPQRRRRIALVADFGGHAAPEILFVRKGVRGDTAPGGETGQGAAGGAADGVNPAVARGLKAKASLSFREDSDTLVLQRGETVSVHLTQDPITAMESTPCLSSGNPDHGQAMIGVLAFSAGQGAKAGGLGIAEECAPSLKAADSGSNRAPVVCMPINDKATRCNGGGDTRNGDGAGNGLGVGRNGDPAPTITAGDRHAVFDARGNGKGDIASTLTGDHQNRVTDYTAIVVLPFDSTQITSPQNGGRSLNYINPVLCMAHGQANAEITENISPTLNCNHEQPIIGTQIVRRLTPLECERLQGYPDGWTDIGAWTDSKGKLHKESSDSARYKALGNSIALPPWKWVLKRLCACYERDATMASLFDGIGGFPLIWEQLNGKGTCLWASEIEEFPMAVTRERFG